MATNPKVLCVRKFASLCLSGFSLGYYCFALEVITDAEAHWVEEPSYLEPEEIQDPIGKIEAEKDLGLCNENPPKNWKLNAQIVCAFSLCEVQGNVY